MPGLHGDEVDEALLELIREGFVVECKNEKGETCYMLTEKGTKRAEMLQAATQKEGNA